MTEEIQGAPGPSRWIAAVLAYRVLLDAWYILAIPLIFFHYPEPVFNPWRVAESVALTLLAWGNLPKRWTRPSDFFVFLLILGVFLPMCTLFAYSDAPRPYMYTVAATVLTLGLARRIPEPRLPRVARAVGLVLTLSYGVTTLVFLWLFVANGARMTFDITALYDVRLITREEVFVGAWAYLIPWVAMVFLPFLVTVAVAEKKAFRLMTLLCMAVLLFGLTTHKYFVLIGLAPLLVHLFWQTKNPPMTVLWVVIVLLAGIGIWYWVSGNPWVVAVGVQRPIFKPAFLNFTYVEVFTGRPLVLMSSGFIGHLIDYPFEVNPAFMVGDYLKGSLDTRSNTGFLGTGFAHFGVLGPWILGVMVAFALKLLDAVSKRLPVWLAVAVAFGPFTSMMTSVDFLPALNTSGGIVCLLLLWALCSQFEESGEGLSAGGGKGTAL